MTPSPLDTIHVARPCSADWEAMIGTDRIRHCADCNLNVYNLSALSAAEAQALVDETEGRRCVRFYRRADGTILTQDCPGEPVDLARERLNGALFTLILLGAWLTAPPLMDAVWGVANRGLESAAHVLSDLGNSGAGGGEWVAGEPMMELPVLGMVAPPENGPPPPPAPAWR
ncbi:MAG: hypothetical protein HKN04_03925 [Rhodothermaceae bacterium]|nr:hypothetical protein [Rhodothermaceae bacterium]